MSEILQHIQHLSRRELLALIREATTILEAREDDELAPEQEAELKRRLEAAERDGFAGDDWPTVKARILAQALQPEMVAAS